VDYLHVLKLHVSASTLAIMRLLAFNLLKDYTIRMVYSWGRGTRSLLSLILKLGILCCVYLLAGEVLGTFILAYVGISCFLRHC
jgi:hypothetical protein